MPCNAGCWPGRWIGASCHPCSSRSVSRSSSRTSCCRSSRQTTGAWTRGASPPPASAAPGSSPSGGFLWSSSWSVCLPSGGYKFSARGRRSAGGAVREASERDVTAAGYTIERGTTASRLGARAGAVLVAALVALPFWGSSGDMRLMVEFLSMLTLAQMWNLLAGYGGLVSVGQQAYVGLGGYALIVLADFLDVNPFVSVFLAGFVTAAFALPTAAVVFRFQGGYFAVGTWVVAEVYYLLLANSSAPGRR